MHSSHTVLRRYTPPTCTLEIIAKGSVLSGWFGRPLLDRVKFQLDFDDPRLPDEKRVTVRGDKTQLDALSEAVQTYVQEFLDRSPDQLNASVLTLAPSDRASSNSLAEPPNGFAQTNATVEMSPLSPADSEQLERDYLPEPPNTNPASTEPPHPLPSEKEFSVNSTPLLSQKATGIYLQPNGLLSHDLHLGSLATEQSGPVIHLSLLQLFDLATALDEYASDVEVLPHFPRARASRPFPAWTGIAAMLVVTVGIATVAVQVMDRKSSRPSTSAPTVSSQATPTEQAPIAAVPAPEATPAVPTPPATSSQTLPALPPSGASVTPTPGATPPAGAIAPTPGATPPAGATVPPPPQTIPPVISRQSPTASPPPSDTYKLPLNSASPPPPAATPNPPDNRATVRVIPSQVAPRQQPPQQPTLRQPVFAPPPPLVAPPTMEPPPPLVAPPASSQNDPPPPVAQIASKPSPQPSPRQQPRPISRPTTSPSPVSRPTSSPAPVASVNPSSVSATPKPQEAAQAPTTPPLQTSPEIAPLPNAGITETPLAARNGVTIAPPSPIASPPIAPNTNSSLFDTIPQVAEARNYFQNRWQPPSNLSQPLEYTVRINSDGSIRQIIPLGQVAEVYLDRTEMPLLGESFVSPIDGKRNPSIRVILKPDGKVQTHLESLD